MQSNTSTPTGALPRAAHAHRASGRALALACALVACGAPAFAATAPAQSPGTDQYTEPPPTGGGQPTNNNAPGGPSPGSSGDGGSSGTSTTAGSSGASGETTTQSGGASGGAGSEAAADTEKGEKKGKDESRSGPGARGADSVLKGAPALAAADGSGDELWRSIWLPLLLVLSLLVAVGIRFRGSRSDDS